MLQMGDIVVIMSASGTFEIVGIRGDEVTIRNAAGVQKIVLSQAVRRIRRPPAPAHTEG
jgi:hypothetical protein